MWLIDFSAFAFFPFEAFVGLQVFGFCGFWLLCFFATAYWCMVFVFPFAALAFALFCLSASVGGFIPSVLVLLTRILAVLS